MVSIFPPWLNILTCVPNSSPLDLLTYTCFFKEAAVYVHRNNSMNVHFLCRGYTCTLSCPVLEPRKVIFTKKSWTYTLWHPHRPHNSHRIVISHSITWKLSYVALMGWDFMWRYDWGSVALAWAWVWWIMHWNITWQEQSWVIYKLESSLTSINQHLIKMLNKLQQIINKLLTFVYVTDILVLSIINKLMVHCTLIFHHDLCKYPGAEIYFLYLFLIYCRVNVIYFLHLWWKVLLSHLSSVLCKAE